MSPLASASRVWIVAPCFNEEEGVREFAAAVRSNVARLPHSLSAQLLLVDDGSRDRTSTIARELALEHADGPLVIELISLSRNFGHQAAIQAGLESAYARSAEDDLFIVMDADLQHPPEWIPQIVEGLKAGAGHVQMLRKDDPKIGVWKRWTSRAFYRVFSFLSGMALEPGSADFRGMTRPFLRAYLSLRERGRFNRALFRWVGFPVLTIPYSPAERFAGVSKYSSMQMLRLGLRGITYFSSRPLMLLLSGTVLASFVLCAVYLAYELWRLSQGIQFAIGWPSVIFFVSFWGGLLALGQLLLALYVSRIFDEVKGRPVYLRSDGAQPWEKHD